MKIDRDAATGYEICHYTQGPERNAKLYFTTENFSVDDKYFFFTKERVDERRDEAVEPGLYRADVQTGEIRRMADAHYSCFAMHWQENYGVMCRGDGMLVRLDIQTGEMTTLGRLPSGAVPQGHLTIANDGRIACSCQLSNKIYALAILDPGQAQAQIVYRTDQWIGHTQICPSDSNLLFYIHETGGDALQRTWMFDIDYRMERPYYVEHPNEWITHETWSADGEMMALMRIPHQIVLGDKDGRHFDIVLNTDKRVLHPGLSRDKRWLCTDASWEETDGTRRDAVMLVNPRNGQMEPLAYTFPCKTGKDHHHPSFNRAGDKILFSAPDENGIAQVCLIDLKQVKRP